MNKWRFWICTCPSCQIGSNPVIFLDTKTRKHGIMVNRRTAILSGDYVAFCRKFKAFLVPMIGGQK